MALTLDWQIEVRLEGHHISKSTTIQTPKVAQKLVCILMEGGDLIALQQLASGYRISFAAHKARQKYNCITVFASVTTLRPATTCTWQEVNL